MQFEPVALRIAVENDKRLRERFERTRRLTGELAANLSDADATVQSMADSSPAKWHLAHTSWFFESCVLADFVGGYVPFDPLFAVLFNSYYDAKGARIARGARGLLTRPSLLDVFRYRSHVEQALWKAMNGLPTSGQELVRLGTEHEEQHQELLVTDLLHLFAQNPLEPVLWESDDSGADGGLTPLTWIEGRHGPVEIGAAEASFSFDCERPRHTTWLTPHALASRLITNSEWLEFITDGGYSRAELWLSDGWTWVHRQQIEAPLYWRREGASQWSQFGLDGRRAVVPAAPVCHISYYEADAFARWAGARLPTESEWESAASAVDPMQGNLLDSPGALRPRPASARAGMQQLFGDVWEWTGSAYLPYPGFRAAAGAVGEYNGKFMSGQFVLRGGSCATPRGHVRASYRNFFYPHQRWQFTGVRLAMDV
jgi:ergothioneine biosynthesis protein EgtB